MARNRPAAANSAATAADLGEAQIKKNRPKNTLLKQQRLPAWQPILNAKTVIPVFYTISALFIPIGIVLLITSNGVKEWSVYYDKECGEQQECTINFSLQENFEGDVYFYYGLENYYQNHRRYMRSRNDLQLMGRLNQIAECGPYDKDPVGRPIAPCGAVANSMFNDTFKLFETTASGLNQIQWNYEELIWPNDRFKFRNPLCNGSPCQTHEQLCTAFESETSPPPNWGMRPCDLDNTTLKNNGFENADFIIWMRTAAFPDFRKPYRKLSDPNYPNGLRSSSNYQLQVVNRYNVSAFGGRKSFIISTTSWLGGRNPFLGYAFIVVGFVCAVIGSVFIFIHVKFGHTLHEMTGGEQPLRNGVNRPHAQ